MIAGQNAFHQFRSHAAQFEWANAYLCLSLTRLAQPESVGLYHAPYQEFEQRAAAILQTWGLHHCRILTTPYQETSILVAANDDVILVAFQGSDTFSVPQLWQHKEAALSVCPAYGPGRIHQEYGGMVECILPSLISAIVALRTHNQAVWLTGHSIGGALAVLTAYRLSKNNISVEGVYTYGQPKVGNWLFMFSFYDAVPPSRYYRFVNYIDIIPDLPAAERPFSSEQTFAHFGQLIYIKGNGLIVRNPHLEVVLADRQTSASFSILSPDIPQADAHDSLLYAARIYKEMPQPIRSTMPVPTIAPLISC